MLHPTSLILLPFVVLVSLVLNSSEVKGIKGPYLHETEEVVMGLQKEHDYLNQLFRDYQNTLVANNDLINAMKAYREAFALTKGTDCAGEEPQNEDADDRVITDFVSGCMKSVPKDEMYAFFNKISLLKDKAVKIDKDYNDACKSNPRSWKEAMNQANAKLGGILTSKLKSEINDVLELLKNRVDECFKSKIAKQLKNLVQGTEAIYKCLDLQS